MKLARLLVLLAVLALAGPVRAQSRCAAPAGATGPLAERDPEVRLAFVRATLLDQASRERLWSRAWAVGGLAIAAGNFGLAALQGSRDKQIAYVVSGVPALFYPLEALVDPPRAIADSALLETLLAATKGTPGLPGKMDTCILLGRAEALLEHTARDERARVNWVRHGLGIAAGLGLGAVLTFALHDTAGGVLDLVGSLAINEFRLWTAPTGAARALSLYRGDGATLYPGSLPAPRAFVLSLPIAF